MAEAIVNLFEAIFVFKMFQHREVSLLQGVFPVSIVYEKFSQLSKIANVRYFTWITRSLVIELTTTDTLLFQTKMYGEGVK